MATDPKALDALARAFHDLDFRDNDSPPHPSSGADWECGEMTRFREYAALVLAELADWSLVPTATLDEKEAENGRLTADLLTVTANLEAAPLMDPRTLSDALRGAWDASGRPNPLGTDPEAWEGFALAVLAKLMMYRRAMHALAALHAALATLPAEQPATPETEAGS